ncbi:PAAR domain-containing protein [Luteimonas sp. SJ-92]|uniref:PAAR domain-containing protein n=1 Tax=Luteimonas salinisoli TaxID=2752307 RepID=A0A853JED6_9GAMM|nr:PAAR domain-containing protein [Luteimonas salinisoli]
MAQNFIVVGDRIDHGGAVVSGSPFTDIDGKPVARVTDRVVCSQHGATSIVTGDATMIIDGQPVARHGDKTACGATLFSSQFRVFADIGTSAGTPARGPMTAAMAAAAVAGTQVEPPELDLQHLQGASPPTEPNWNVARDVIVDSHAALMAAGAYREYDTEAEAAREWRQHVLPVADRHGVEVGALIAQTANGKYRLGAPWSSGERATIEDIVSLAPRSAGRLTAAVHTHPAPHGWGGGDRAFSRYDRPGPDGTGGYGGEGDIQAGDFVYGYYHEINVYIADSEGLHGWIYDDYVKIQLQDRTRAVPLREGYRSF